MNKRRYPRVGDSNGQPRELTKKEKTKFDSLVYKYGHEKGSEVFLLDFPVYFCSKEAEKEKQQELENEKELIKFYLKPENKSQRKKISVKKLFARHGLKTNGTPLVK